MKAYRKYVVIGCWIAGWMAGGCSSVTVGEAGDGMTVGAIGFTSGMTKAAVTDVSEMENIRVWGTYTKGGSSAEVFGTAGQEVHYAGGAWTYSPVRYWVMGAEYDFYAVHPAEVAGVTVEDGGIEIKGFDATEGHDLMAATAKGIRYDEVSAIQPVSLTFEHLLARVNIVGMVTGGGQMHVQEIDFTGMKETGDYGANGWTGLQEGGGFLKTGFTLNSAAGTDIFGDLLMIPQAVAGLEISMTYTENDKTEAQTQTVTYPLPAGEVAEWEAGRSYRYTFTVDVAGNIIFMKPVVTEWNTATGGIVTVE